MPSRQKIHQSCLHKYTNGYSMHHTIFENISWIEKYNVSQPKLHSPTNQPKGLLMDNMVMQLKSFAILVFLEVVQLLVTIMDTLLKCIVLVNLIYIIKASDCKTCLSGGTGFWFFRLTESKFLFFI